MRLCGCVVVFRLGLCFGICVLFFVFFFNSLNQSTKVPPRNTLHFEISGEGLETAVVGSRARFRILVLQDGPGGPPVENAGGRCVHFHCLNFVLVVYLL